VKGLQHTVLIFALAILSSQSIHYVYMKFFYPTTSVLDTELDVGIREAKSLDELVAMHEKSEQAVQEYERQLSPEDRKNNNRWDAAPYRSQNEIADAIRDWERKNEQFRRLLVQWTYGLIIAAIGVAAYARGFLWVGTALVVAGMGEMLWWCSPSIRLEGAFGEFDRLLNTKLLLSVLTAAMLAITWRTWSRDRPRAT